jgi:hypothetical protein
MPDGVILGPFDATDLIQKWTQGDIPSDAEISAGGKPWIFFKKHKKLFDMYPEFNTSQVRGYISHIAPPSTTVLSALRTTRLKAFSHTPLRKKIFITAAIVSLIIIVTLFLLTWMELSMLRDTTLL